MRLHMNSENSRKAFIAKAIEKICRVGCLSASIINKHGSLRKLIFMTGAAVIVVLVLGLSQCHTISKNKSQEAQADVIIYNQVKKSTEMLSLLQQKVDTLSQNLNSSQSVTDIDNLKQGLTQISTQIESLQKDNAQSLKEIMESENSVVNQKLDELKEGVTELKDLQHPVKYLPAKELPFSVQSIDLIQQQPVVTIGYANKTQPLYLGYSVAGWELVKANYGQQRAEFKNKDDAHIVINLAMQGDFA